MADETDKPRPVQMKMPGLIRDRTNELKIERDKALRLIARYLRERMSPDDANKMAARICDGIVASMSTPVRPALRGYRMIPEHAPYEIRDEVAKALRSICREDEGLSMEAWRVIYGYGEPVPDDMVI